MKWIIDWIKLITLNLPSKLRGVRVVLWVYCLLTGTRLVWDKLLVLREEIQEEFRRTCQVLALERLLNNLFDPTLRRIFITDAVTIENPSLWLISETQVNPSLWLISEIPPNSALSISLISEANSSVNFVIWVPTGLVYEAIYMRGLVDKYKFAGVTYEIQQY